MKKKIIPITICFIILMTISISFNFISNKKDNVSYNEIKIDNSVIYTSVNYEEIINSYIDRYNNTDVVGEIKILNTDYSKAIMQAKDNDYYLNHLEDKRSSFMGSIYLDFRIDIEKDKKILIFGHNSQTIEMPFKILENYYNKDYYNNHKYIQITTKKQIRTYEIYAVLVEPTDFSYMKTTFENDEQWYHHIQSFKDKSMYDTGVEVMPKDNIIILQTCSYHYNYKMYEKKYLLVIGKEIF